MVLLTLVKYWISQQHSANCHHEQTVDKMWTKTVIIKCLVLPDTDNGLFLYFCCIHFCLVYRCEATQGTVDFNCLWLTNPQKTKTHQTVCSQKLYIQLLTPTTSVTFQLNFTTFINTIPHSSTVISYTYRILHFDVMKIADLICPSCVLYKKKKDSENSKRFGLLFICCFGLHCRLYWHLEGCCTVWNMDVLEAQIYIFCSQTVKHKSFSNSTSPLIQHVIQPAINFSSIAILGAIQISLRNSLNKKS